MQLLIPRIANAFRILAAIVLAQLACQPVVAQIEDDFLMDEILVTATKREASIQDIPISVQGIGSEILDSRGAVDLRGIVQLSPSVSLITSQSVANTASIRIRGIGTTGNNAGFESSVGIFVDGVYQPRPGIAFGEFADIEQVEILRGPQGTLFGRNTSVGAISVKSKRPDIFNRDGYATLSVGNYGMVNVAAGMNQPLGDTLALRVGGSYRNREGTMSNANPALPDSNNIDRYLVRAQMLWEPTEDFSLRLFADTSESDERCCDPVLVSLNTTGPSQPPGTTLDPATAREDRITDSQGRSESSDQYGFSGELIWDINESIELTYLPAYRDSEALSSGDDDFTAVDIVHIDPAAPTRANVESQTHELRFHGLAFEGYLDWLVGFYFGNEDISELSVRFAGSSLPPGLAGSTSANLFEQRGESYSIFMHNMIDLTEKLTLTLGLRYVDERKRGGLVSSIGANPACPAPDGNPANDDPIACNPIFTPAASTDLYALYPNAEFEDDALTYTANLAASLSSDMLLYASVSEGFKSGGLNLDITGTGSARPHFDSEVVTSYELGAKTRLAGGRMTANLTLYHMDIDDFQLLTFSGVSFSVFNVAKAKSTGAELDVDVQFDDNFLLKTSIAYTDARFPNSCSTDPVAVAQCGNDMPNAPEVAAVVGADWTLSLSPEIRVVLTPNARFETSSQPSPFVPSFKQKSNTVVDLRASFESKDDRFAVELWGKNVTDEDNYTRAFDTVSNLVAPPGTSGSQYSWLIDPRTYGVTFRSKF